MPKQLTQHPINFIVDHNNHALRLDQVLARNYPEFSRNRWQDAINAGTVLLNGAAAKSKSLVCAGDQITGVLTQEIQTEDSAQNLPLNILYADDDIIVINKPAGLVVHPAVGNHDNTLLNALLYHFPQTKHLPRSGIVHRLDKDTSGAMVIAHSARAHTELVHQLQNRSMGRIYLALVYGYITAGDTIDLPIGRHAKDRLKMAVRPDGKPAITHYHIEERWQTLTLLRVQLETGRTHQIRVHLSHHRHPLVGDKLYGARPFLASSLTDLQRQALAEFPRQALHAVELHLHHPATNEIMRFTAPLPDDMTQLFTILRAQNPQTP